MPSENLKVMLAIWSCNNFHCPNREKFKRYISHVTINTNLDQIMKITSESEVLSIYLVFSPQYCMTIKCSLFISLPVDNSHWCCGVVFVWGFFFIQNITKITTCNHFYLAIELYVWTLILDCKHLILMKLHLVKY